MAKITSSQFFGIEEPQSSLSQRLSSIGNIDDIYTDTNAPTYYVAYCLFPIADCLLPIVCYRRARDIAYCKYLPTQYSMYVQCSMYDMYSMYSMYSMYICTVCA